MSSKWNQWTRLRAPLTISQYSGESTVRDWSSPDHLTFQATLDPATNLLYAPGTVDVVDGDSLLDPDGQEWHIVTNLPYGQHTTAGTDISQTPQNPIRTHRDQITGRVDGMVISIERWTP